MAVGDKIGDVVLRGAKSRLHAYWRPTDGTPAVWLCAISRAAYERHPHVRKLFVELASEIQINRDRPPESPVTLLARELRL
jgi:hypothetical protein